MAVQVKGKRETRALTGNEAFAHAMRQIDPDTVCAYPITPATEIVQIFSQFVADGIVHTEYVPVESEHSAMSASIGSAAAGARAMTGTSSQGLALMWEMLYIAAGLRLPIVMGVVNRSLSSPINIHCDHSDTMGARDTGWVQLFSENSQEAYDNLIQCVRIAEHTKIRLPAMATLDGFIISHALEPVDMLTDDEVKEFVGEPKPEYSVLDFDHPITAGALDLFDYYFEHKRSEIEPVFSVPEVVKEIGKEYGDLTGRSFDIFEKYRVDDAEVVAIALGSTAGTAKVAVDESREHGIAAGLIKVRMYRPFPYREIADVLQDKKVVCVMDRSDGMAGFGGQVFGDVRSALYDRDKRPVVTNVVYGLGGRDIKVGEIVKIYEDMRAIADGKREPVAVSYVGVRE
jgi:pyruvate ferredoxin oxidoreductase alpha subunit